MILEVTGYYAAARKIAFLNRQAITRTIVDLVGTVRAKTEIPRTISNFPLSGRQLKRFRCGGHRCDGTKAGEHREKVKPLPDHIQLPTFCMSS